MTIMFTSPITRSARHAVPSAQRGLALVFVLVMMSIATGIALIAARITLLSDRAARNDSDRQVAFQSAELALQDARDDIMSPKIGRGCQLGTSLTSDEGCLTDSVSRGVCKHKPALGDKPLYHSDYVNWEEAESSGTRAYVNYGEFTGRLNSLQVGTFGAPSKAPKYIIVDESDGLKMFVPGLAGADGFLTNKMLSSLKAYRIFALGYGASPSTQVMLEGVIIKPQVATQCTSS